MKFSEATIPNVGILIDYHVEIGEGHHILMRAVVRNMAKVNQLTRSAFPAMQQTAEDILKYHRAKEVDGRLMPIKNIITLIDEL